MERWNGLVEDAEKIKFDYADCKYLYAEWALGKRFVESIIDYALSQKREITIQNAPDEVKERFEKIAKKYKIDHIVRRTAIVNRIYGASGLYVTSDDAPDDGKKFTIEEKMNYRLKFNILDPLNFRTMISQNPRSPDFQKPIHTSVGGMLIDKQRIYIAFNGDPLFIYWSVSALNFAGRSVFENLKRLIVLWDNLMEALDRISLKASSLVITNNQSLVKSAVDFAVGRETANYVKSMKQGQVAMLNKGQAIEFFNLNGVTEIQAMIKEVKEALVMALNDTPIQILLDKDLSNGLSNGSEDMRSVVIKVNQFREQYLNPIYDFLDEYLFYQAWDDAFIKDLKQRHKHLRTFGAEELRQIWKKEFDYEWKSIYPKTPDEETKALDSVLERILKAQELGVSTEDLQELINDSKIFNQLVRVEKQETPLFKEEVI